MNANNLTTHHRIYPSIDSHHKDKKETYVNIRIVKRKDRNKTIDIAVYWSNGVRLKVKPASFSKGQVTRGFYDEAETNRINEWIIKVWSKAKDFMEKNPVATKQLIEDALYGITFLENHKQSRTQEIHIPITESKPTQKFIELRKFFPKRKETVITSFINADGFEEDHTEEVIIDPLDYNAESFPQHFPKEYYEELKEEYLKTHPTKDLSDQKEEWFLHQWMKFRLATLFKQKSVIKEVMKIQPETVKAFKKKYNTNEINPWSYGININGKHAGHGGDKHKLIELQNQLEFNSLSTETIYEKGLFDKSDLLHVFGSIYFDQTLTNKQNARVIIRIFDYIESTGASRNLSDYSVNWAKGFLSWINTALTPRLSSKSFDPIKYKKEVFTEADREDAYTSSSMEKQVISFKVVTKHLTEKGLLPKIDYDQILFSHYRKTVSKGTRKLHHLLLEEFETLLTIEFKESKLDDYRTKFDKLKSSGVIKGTFKNDVTIENLNKYRDAFALQVMIGGLRGLDEYQSVEVIPFDKEGNVFRFFQNKTQGDKEKPQHILNPHNKFTKEILKRNNNKLPEVSREELINGYLKLIGHIAKLDREVEKGVVIKDSLSQYWARKTYGNILFAEGISEGQIALFTGHELRESQLSTSYLDLQNVTLKRKIYKSIGFS